jgi:hypothetical protein
VSSGQKLLWGIAVVAFVLGICGAFVRGFWGVSHDCQSWVDSHGYRLVRERVVGQGSRLRGQNADR